MSDEVPHTHHGDPPVADSVAGAPVAPVSETADGLTHETHPPEVLAQILDGVRAMNDTLAGVMTKSSEGEIREIHPEPDETPVKPPWTHRALFGGRKR